MEQSNNAVEQSSNAGPGQAFNAGLSHPHPADAPAYPPQPQPVTVADDEPTIVDGPYPPEGRFPSTDDDRVVNNVMRHQYRVLSAAEKAQMQLVKDLGLHFHETLSTFGSSRELSLAKTKIEEAVMWATKHITA